MANADGRSERVERGTRHGAIAALHGHRGAIGGRTIRRLPAPFAAIVVELGGRPEWRAADRRNWRPYPRVALHGLMTVWSEGRFAAGTSQDCLMALIEPWAVPFLLQVEAAATVDNVIDLEHALPQWSTALLDAVERADDPQDRLARLERAVADRIGRERPGPELAEFVAASRASAGGLRLDAFVRAVGARERSFRNTVRAALGVPPKQWCVLERFSANLARLHPGPWRDGRPAEPDYFDQAHEIHEFRRLAGITPGAYRREKLAGDRRVYATG